MIKICNAISSMTMHVCDLWYTTVVSQSETHGGKNLFMHLSQHATQLLIIDSVAACDTSHDNRIHHDVWHVPWIIIPQNDASSLISYTSSIHIKLVTTISHNKCKWHVHTINLKIIIFIIMHNLHITIVIEHQWWINKLFKSFSTYHTPIINYIVFY